MLREVNPQEVPVDTIAVFTYHNKSRAVYVIEKGLYNFFGWDFTCEDKIGEYGAYRRFLYEKTADTVTLVEFVDFAEVLSSIPQKEPKRSLVTRFFNWIFPRRMEDL
jgi:hypothetical protein